jgi:hypothetical protein
VLALSSALAAQAGLPQGPGRFDLGSQLMLRVFGETSDSGASFAAAHGDRSSESPLRELALQVRAAGAKPDLVAGDSEAFAADHLAMSDISIERSSSFGQPAQFDASPSIVHFSVPSQYDETLVEPSAHFTAAYQPVAAAPAVSPEPGTLAFGPPQGQGDTLPLTTRIGAVQFEGKSQGVSTQTPQVASRDTSDSAGANFDVRAGKRSFNLNLSSEYEQLHNDAGTFSVSPLDSAKSWQLPGLGAQFVVPNSADLNRLSLGAGLSVPVVRGLTLNLNYDAQRLYGGYGLPGLMNLDAVDNSFGGKLTFNIPQSSSALSIGAYQDRLQDNILPLNGYTQTREDVNFTVKF